ncbi:putative metalloprotease CJM1_0395 family protein [Marinobacterium weihaiense]|uniref:SprA-related family protein n=1 Tax=Marinobacterium weihaiense TaxID=2851016 RepID=A0ABS6MCI8_9GAMM|nr:putative metalloprotease CJM1_0395 family protein [Marinobacterium weihaiense]MBV0933437.1 hypothetical protein [Marinobacterium weihaiense]
MPLLSSISSSPVTTGYAPAQGSGGAPAARTTVADGTVEPASGRSAEPRDQVEATDKGQASLRAGDENAAQQLQEQKILRELSARDLEVRQHEMAHQAAGGGHTGAVSYDYQRGPDGRMYAVGGEVSIDTSAVSGNPRATLEKAEAIIRAAMAPAEPSSQDYRVAASARAMAADARAELTRLQEEASAVDESDTENEAVSGSESAGPGGDNTGTRPATDTAPGTASATAANDSGANGLNSVQQQLIKSGAYSPLYPPGSLFSLQA